MGTRGKDYKRKHQSKSWKAGLLFPVSRMARYLKKGGYARRVGFGAPIYMAAVLEYLAAEMLQIAGNAAREYKNSRIIPRHILLAVGNDVEFDRLLNQVSIAVPIRKKSRAAASTEKGE